MQMCRTLSLPTFLRLGCWRLPPCVALAAVLAACGGGAVQQTARTPTASPERRDVDYDVAARSVRETLRQLVAADTTNPPGNEARAVAIAASKLAARAIPFKTYELAPGRQSLVARLRATAPVPGRKPILLLSHADVVTAEGQAWTTPPHQLTERGKYLHGRGVADMLGMAAVELEVLLLLEQSGVSLDRDVIFALVADEESDGKGIQQILATDPGALDAAVALNEGGGITLHEGGPRDGTPKFLAIQAAEKIYQDFELIARAQPGHSSAPLDDNAIYRLARALDRLAAHREPARLIEVTRGFFEARASFEEPQLAAAMRELAHASNDSLPAAALAEIDRHPLIRSLLRTTCVATLLRAGSRVNTLAADAVATVNCRIMPDESVASARSMLARVVADERIEIRALEAAGAGAPSPLTGEGVDAARDVAQAMWPGLPVLPVLDAGASDSRFLRQLGIAAYGLSPLPGFESDDYHIHGEDERVPVASLRTGVEFLHRWVLALARARDAQSQAR